MKTQLGFKVHFGQKFYSDHGVCHNLKNIVDFGRILPFDVDYCDIPQTNYKSGKFVIKHVTVMLRFRSTESFGVENEYVVIFNTKILFVNWNHLTINSSGASTCTHTKLQAEHRVQHC